MDKTFFRTAINGIILVAAFVLGIMILYWTTGIFKDELVTTSSPTPIPSASILPVSQYPEYDSILGESPDRTFKSIKLNDQSKTNPVSAAIDPDGLSGNIISQGKIETAHLYIEAFVDFTTSFKQGDDFYFILNESGKPEVEGGHLSPKQSLPIPPDTDFKGTQLLYTLDTISYWSSVEDLRVKTAYWKSLLNTNKKLIWRAFVSSDRSGGTIKNISIFYRCSEETPECSITKLK